MSQKIKVRGSQEALGIVLWPTHPHMYAYTLIHMCAYAYTNTHTNKKQTQNLTALVSWQEKYTTNCFKMHTHNLDRRKFKGEKK